MDASFSRTGDESLLPTSSKDRTFNHNVLYTTIPFWMPNHQNNTPQRELSVSSKLLLPNQLVYMHNTSPPIPGGKALLPPMIKTEGKPTTNSEGLTHSKGCVMQHKHPMVVVQQRSLSPGCPSSLCPSTVRSPEPLPAALLPARSLRTGTTRPPPQRSAAPQGHRARAETTDRGAGAGTVAALTLVDGLECAGEVAVLAAAVHLAPQPRRRRRPRRRRHLGTGTRHTSRGRRRAGSGSADGPRPRRYRALPPGSPALPGAGPGPGAVIASGPCSVLLLRA